MIAFGSLIVEPKAYVRFARPGIELASEADSEVYAIASVGPVARGCNLLMEHAARRDDLEALVLVHPHARIDDPAFCAKLRAALADQDVAVVGVAGATNVRSLAWWEGEVVSGPVTHRYEDHRGGSTRAYAWTATRPAPAEVEVVDGFLMALSPWAVRNMLFDEALVLGHGVEVDFCRQARLAHKKVVAADIQATFHRALELFPDSQTWVEAHIQLAEKWDEPVEDEAAWKARARRAEAEREVARAIAYSLELGSDARVLALERRLEQTLASPSWRLTAPLRSAGAALRRRRARRG